MLNERADRERYAARVRGCLLGGAIGDALGAPVEFDPLGRILDTVGDQGVRAYLPDETGAHGRITDDTQMTLFTVEGLIQAEIRTDRGLGFTVAVVHRAYDHWLDTQQLAGPVDRAAGGSGGRRSWLLTQPWLYSRRAPGETCLSALEEARGGERYAPRYGLAATNDSKGCGGVMRSAPFGLLPPGRGSGRAAAFDLAAEAASFTHGHPTGQLAAGSLAALVGGLVDGEELDRALDATMELLRDRPDHEETAEALDAARKAHELSQVGPATVESLGGGWVGEEALAIAVYSALSFPEPDQMLDALALAVTHSGDSDSTGAICGNILGALHGDTALPPALAFEVEGRGTILQLADDFVWEFTRRRQLHGAYGPSTRWTKRY